jgi:hypothetical protein
MASSLDSAPEDVLLEVFLRCTVFDILSLKQVRSSSPFHRKAARGLIPCCHADLSRVVRSWVQRLSLAQDCAHDQDPS